MCNGPNCTHYKRYLSLQALQNVALFGNKDIKGISDNIQSYWSWLSYIAMQM